MLLSNRYKFLFIKTRKTAGTSLEIVLSQYCDLPGDVVTPLSTDDESHRRTITSVAPHGYRFNVSNWVSLPATLIAQRRLFRDFDSRLFRYRYWNHVGGRVIKARARPEQWGYFKFTIERDPWDKIISCYYWLLGYLSKSPAELTLRDFFDQGWAEWLSDFRLYTENGRLLVDKVINYDYLQEGLSAVAADIGLPADVRLDRSQVNAKATSSLKKKLASELFDTDLERRGRLLFAREIELFNFRESPHALNTLRGPFLNSPVI